MKIEKVLKINIIDQEYNYAFVFLGIKNKEFFTLVRLCNGKESKLITGSNPRLVFDLAKDFFSQSFDGFIQSEELSIQDNSHIKEYIQQYYKKFQ